ncbi:tRNA (adenosine(37)-N6)-threonylcarbamoyltransferase complex ATPase subunit type 1 TsaE [Sediminibacillus albus]|uniref:tRNA threonylcarbamoyladenosine biosynthesis protein TsaE n=1 Tax=Sediminibacillus albus TaxID=407036 RepID=A0A1G9BG06_9BACI|nr:tRNA (adenosine(37)-N6)-threonylcarbamoyltransferase complex ATPase subunit type 1 TsaE [Sediminibacillus albus]SDK38448.1 tRNA threonylcarbamoyladenosine biosynthesis protein TsaE [Sediminibacillus albus]
MEEMTMITQTETETKKLAEKLALLLKPNDVVTLEGDLGAGKTTFTKGLGAGLGVRRTINSPTFTIVKEYSGEIPLYHMDVYRLEDSDEDIGFNEYFNAGGITVIEWAHFIADFLPEQRLDIEICLNEQQEREVTFYPRGNHFELICKELAR